MRVYVVVESELHANTVVHHHLRVPMFSFI